MAVMERVSGALGSAWERFKGYVRSVPPDVWIGLLIGAATLAVVYLAYRKSASSNPSTSSITNPGGTPVDTSSFLPLTDAGTSSTAGTLPIISTISTALANLGNLSTGDQTQTVTHPAVDMSHAIAQQSAVQQARQDATGLFTRLDNLPATPAAAPTPAPTPSYLGPPVPITAPIYQAFRAEERTAGAPITHPAANMAAAVSQALSTQQARQDRLGRIA